MPSPRFTLRTLLAVTAGCAVLFLVLGLAFRDQSWTWLWALLIALLSVAVTLLMHAAWFGVASLFARLLAEAEPSDGSDAARRPRSGTSPDEEAVP